MPEEGGKNLRQLSHVQLYMRKSVLTIISKGSLFVAVETI